MPVDRIWVAHVSKGEGRLPIGARVPVRIKLHGSRADSIYSKAPTGFGRHRTLYALQNTLSRVRVFHLLPSLSQDLSIMEATSSSHQKFPDDYLPPENTYESRAALVTAINEWAYTRGYAFVTKRSTKEKSGKLTVVYACDRSCREYASGMARQRKTTTRSSNCPFSVLAKESRDGDTWTLQYRPDRQFGQHNHEPSLHPSAHPIHRALDTEAKTRLSSLSNAGVPPKEIRTYIRQNTSSIATQQDIYNRIADSRREMCEGQSTINALANQLDREGFWSRLQLDSDNRVKAVLFAHPESLNYLQAYPDVLILDCTYKTNKYGMPLLDMIGVDASQRSFCIAFAFLSGEGKEDFVWALDRLRSLYEISKARLPSVVLTDRCLACINAIAVCFPSAASLLCLWHANKAVLRYCQPSFVNQLRFPNAEAEKSKNLEDWNIFYHHWHQIMKSPTE